MMQLVKDHKVLKTLAKSLHDPNLLKLLHHTKEHVLDDIDEFENIAEAVRSSTLDPSIELKNLDPPEDLLKDVHTSRVLI